VADAKACAEKCKAVADDKCKGFDYNSADKKCILVKEDVKAGDGGADTQNCYTKKDTAAADPLADYEKSDASKKCEKKAGGDLTEKDE
jgi:hypothetical protein